MRRKRAPLDPRSFDDTKIRYNCFLVIDAIQLSTSWFLVFQVESLRKDIEILSQNHERDVDRKDAIIQMLDRDLEEVRGLMDTLP